MTCDQATSRATATIDPHVIKRRGPRWSSQCPTGAAASPESRIASDRAPDICPRVQPISASIAGMKVEKP